MTLIKKSIDIKDEELILTNQRALFWKRENVLVLSDIHIGKTAHFRKHGIPMPDNILDNDLERLKSLILHFEAKNIWIVGDLFHAENNGNMATFKSWLHQFEDLKITLIKGNHDRLLNEIMDDFNIKVETELNVPPFKFIHEPTNDNNQLFTIAGHIHPGVMIKGKGRQKLRLPCFQVSDEQLILPAFSEFTGLNTRLKPENCVNFAFTETAIFEF
ncbi:ligase-associated DNA damage response endonuclease PdeM [Winogradskyella bathintestinalis]|uniref:Ligase-associated DNA damage response endonuclease PdeM n=1 Tax=Winogradskyella bathintestinalis TaxID=3035208 RepID=A0ABT7ZWZ0_9FLAO|nr:ligase-associated DNA damage response endonuclease PdeM [Winogradskyella bathintestinalis]MDN3493253.1 ligase-associated DNA damage response endonuclease PdeM [Winogradskyella bathintestinalis]